MFELKPIGAVINSRKEIGDDFWGGIVSEIVLSEEFEESALKGIEEFSHLEIVFYFDRVDDKNIRRSAHHPRNNPDWSEGGGYLPKEVRTVQTN